MGISKVLMVFIQAYVWLLFIRLYSVAVNLASSETVAGETIFEECVVPQNVRNNTEAFTSRHVGVMAEEEFGASHVEGNSTEEPISANNRPDTEPNLSSGAASDVENSQASSMVDAVGEVEHPVILSGEREIPFTYLTSFLAKWTTQKDNTPFIQGKIKVIYILVWCYWNTYKL